MSLDEMPEALRPLATTDDWPRYLERKVASMIRERMIPPDMDATEKRFRKVCSTSLAFDIMRLVWPQR